MLQRDIIRFYKIYLQDYKNDAKYTNEYTMKYIYIQVSGWSGL